MMFFGTGSNRLVLNNVMAVVGVILFLSRSINTKFCINVSSPRRARNEPNSQLLCGRTSPRRPEDSITDRRLPPTSTQDIPRQEAKAKSDLRKFVLGVLIRLPPLLGQPTMRTQRPHLRGPEKIPTKTAAKYRSASN